MDPITTNTLNKNNVMTTRYFNNGTVYADFLKTSDGQLYDVKNLTSEIELEDVRDDINNINTELADLNTKINNLQGDVDLMSIDIQTDLFSPLYTSPNEISRMSGLTSYVSSALQNESVSISSDPFFGVINMNTNLTDIMDFSFKNLPSHIFNNIPSLINLSSTVIGKLKIQYPFEVSSENNKADVIKTMDRFFNFNLTLEGVETMIYSKVLSIFVPDRVYNQYDKQVYKLHTIYTEKPGGSTFNNFQCCSYMYLLFRNHVYFSVTVTLGLFVTNTDSTFAATRLNYVFLKPVLFSTTVNIFSPDKITFKVYYVLQSKKFFDSLGLFHSTSYPLIEDSNITITLSKYFSTTKAIKNILLPSDSWFQYSVSGDWLTYITGNQNMIVESSDTNIFERYLLSLAKM